MNTQPEALRLAGLLETDGWPDAAAELRRLHEVNQMLVEANGLALEALNSFDLYDGNELWSSSADADDIDLAITKLRLSLSKAKEQA
jgi:hypothetical protein